MVILGAALDVHGVAHRLVDGVVYQLDGTPLDQSALLQIGIDEVIGDLGGAIIERAANADQIGVDDVIGYRAAIGGNEAGVGVVVRTVLVNRVGGRSYNAVEVVVN